MSQQKILLIDYDPASIKKTATPLTKAGYHVEVAKDGVAGLELFETLQPDLVLAEAMLPRKHGFEVCQEIKAKADGESTPVLITTAVCRGRKYRMDALQIYGCDEYIEKPIADTDLVAMIQKFIAAAKEATAAVQQDLSQAIDEAAPAEASTPDSPEAIESMSDDEIEAKIDALLLGDDSPPDAPIEAAEPIAPPSGFVVNETPEAAEPQPEIVAAPEPAPMPEPQPQPEPQLQAEPAEAVATLTEPQPEILPEPQELPVEEPADEPVEAAAEEATLPEVEEWTETATPPATDASDSKKSKMPLIAASIVLLLLAGVGGFGWTQGWFGGGSSSDADGAQVASMGIPMSSPEELMPAAEENEPISLPVEQPFSGDVEPQQEEQPQQTRSQPQPQQAEPEPPVPTKPVYRGPSREKVEAVRQAKADAEAQLEQAAGSLESSLLAVDEGVEEMVEPSADDYVDVELDTASFADAAVPPPSKRGDLVEISSVDVLPQRIEFEQPVYDELAMRLRQQGTVVVEVLIDENGTVTDVRLIEGIAKSRLNDATLRSARRWTYKPAQKNGVAVKVWKPERIVFKL